MMTLQELYQEELRTPSDINEHLPTLYGLARECGHVTEMGTRTGRSTRAFLYAQPEVLICYDLERRPEIDLLEAAARQVGRPRFEFRQADVLRVDVEATDLLFIDTLHVFEQTRAEVARHAGKVRRYLVFHDTTTFGETGEFPGSRGIWPAIEELLGASPEWQILVRLTHNNGLTVLQRAPASNGRSRLVPHAPSSAIAPIEGAEGPVAGAMGRGMAIVVPVHDALACVQRALPTILLTCPGVPLIVVDDHSGAETEQWLRRFLVEAWPCPPDWPRVLLRNERQQLFTRSANRGIRCAYGLRCGPGTPRSGVGAPVEFVAVVNSDCELQENWLKALLLGMDDPAVGIVGFSNASGCEEPLFQEMREPDFIGGHCVLLRMKMLEEIGVFCETDTDGRDSPGMATLKGQAHVGSDRGLSWRANRAGWKTLYCRCPLCFHPGGGSWHDDLAWLSRFDLQPLWPPCDRLENPGWVEETAAMR